MLLTEKYPEHLDLIRFGDHCNWAWDCFQLAKAYCNAEDIHGWCGVDSYLVPILREYSLLQIAKIHDPKQSSGHPNHSLDYLAALYSAEADSVMVAFKKKNADLIESVCQARKKVIAHNDLAALNSDRRFGAFENGADNDYFRSLHQVVARLYDKAGIGPFPEWPSFAQHDAELFLKVVRTAQRSRQGENHVAKANAGGVG